MSDWKREMDAEWRRKEEAWARADAKANMLFAGVLMLPFVPLAIIGAIVALSGATP